MKIKRCISCLLTLLLLFGLAGCGNDNSSSSSSSSGTSSSGSSVPSSPTSNDGNKITVWAWDPAFNIAALERAKELYEAKHTDVTIEIIEYSQDDIIQKLNTALSSGNAKGLPNISLIEDYRIQSFLTAYPNAFVEMTDKIDINQFAEYKRAFTVKDGVTYGVPFDTGAAALFFRTDLLNDAGYDTADLQNVTWDDYMEMGEAIKAKGDGTYLLTLDPDDLGLIRTIMQSCGTWYVKEDGVTPYFVGNEPMKQALQIFADLISKGYAKQTSDWSQFVGAFNNGEAATTISGCWIIPSILAEDSQSGKWSVAPFPRLAGVEESVNASNLGGSSFYVFKGVANSELAQDFLAETFGSSTELYDMLLNDIGAVGTYSPSADSPALDEELPFFGGQRVYEDFYNWVEQIPAVNYGSSTYEYEDILKQALQQVLRGGDVDEALEAAQKQAESQIGNK